MNISERENLFSLARLDGWKQKLARIFNIAVFIKFLFHATPIQSRAGSFIGCSVIGFLLPKDWSFLEAFLLKL